jgi:tetratricopeptide (TPR) repeat protein
MYSIFIPNEYWGAFDFYAPTAFRLDVKDQSTNAMSNWGVAHYIQGNFEMAIKCFEIALDREDKFAEDEASFYLSKIYEKQGDLAKSEEYRKRCEAAGGYEPTYI